MMSNKYIYMERVLQEKADLTQDYVISCPQKARKPRVKFHL